MAGETQNYHESRNPITQTADYSSITGATTSKSIMSVTADLPGSPLVYPAGYWQIGKKWHVRMYMKITSGATPGNLTIEIRMQTGTAVTDAGGTIMATSAAVALVGGKTAASCFLDFTVESRAQIGTAAPLFVKGIFFTDPTFGLVASTALPIFVPSNAAAATNFDTTLAGTVNVQMKNSGANANTYVVQDLQVNSITQMPTNPGPHFVPWMWRLHPHVDRSLDIPPATTWLWLNLVRRPKSSRFSPAYRLSAPATFAIMPHPELVYLQAINRSSTFQGASDRRDVAFIARPAGSTLRRVQDALLNPHPFSERHDPEYKVAMRCSRCGKLAYGPRFAMRDAMISHWEEDCPARRSQADAPKEMRLFYPRV